jgi:hypothetical protein
MIASRPGTAALGFVLAILAGPAAAQTPPPSATPKAAGEIQVEGDMAYGRRPVDLEFFVQINLDTGEARVAPESLYRLTRLREIGELNLEHPIDLELHPALVEQGVLRVARHHARRARAEGERGG